MSGILIDSNGKLMHCCPGIRQRPYRIKNACIHLPYGSMYHLLPQHALLLFKEQDCISPGRLGAD